MKTFRDVMLETEVDGRRWCPLGRRMKSSPPENLGALLLPWLKANAEEMAADLRDAGWEEDGRGLWSGEGYRRLHLFDAQEIVRRHATPTGRGR